MPTLLMMSHTQNVKHKMAALTAVLSPLSSISCCCCCCFGLVVVVVVVVVVLANASINRLISRCASLLLTRQGP